MSGANGEYPPVSGSAWKVWHIRVTFLHEQPRFISHTVKARSKDEAERKAGAYLSGRGTMLYEVLTQNAPHQVLERSDNNLQAEVRQ